MAEMNADRANILTLLPELLRTFQDYDIVVYGLILILMTMFMPGGLARGIPAMIGSLSAKRGNGGDEHA